MTVSRRKPQTKDFLSPINFHFSLARAPGLTFFVQKGNIPGMSIGEIGVATPFAELKYAGGRVSYQDLVITYKVDEKMQSYLEIYDWMRALGHPEDFAQYQELTGDTSGVAGVFSDATLVVLSNQRRPAFNVTYKNCIPISLSGIDFDATSQTLDAVTTTAQFAYESYTIEPVDPSA